MAIEPGSPLWIGAVTLVSSLLTGGASAVWIFLISRRG
jgi:hypothetical protein